jgi:hypothetical protein
MRPCIADMVTIAARLSRTSESDVVGERRFAYLCAIRYAVYATAREWDYSYPAIGRLVGNRDHSSVINSIQSRERLALQFKNFDLFCAEVSRWADELPPFVKDTGWKPPRTFRLAVSEAARLKRDRENAQRAKARKQRIAIKRSKPPQLIAAAPTPSAIEQAPDAQYMRMVNGGIARGSASLLKALRKAA